MQLFLFVNVVTKEKKRNHLILPCFSDLHSMGQPQKRKPPPK